MRPTTAKWCALCVALALALVACSSDTCPFGRSGDTGACLTEPRNAENDSISAAQISGDADAGADE